MEHGAWTNERLDDLAEAMRSGFSRVDQDIRDLRLEMREGFLEVRGEISGVRTELGSEIRDVRGEINGLRRIMFAFGSGIIIALIAAILARGV